MRKLEIIGNLGADAELRNENGSQFVKLSIAENVRRKDASGREYESTEWTNATINGDGGNLLPYLKKGTKVYATGDISLRLFHSEKERRMIPSINLFVRSIELVGGQVDEVPRDLYDLDGVAHRVTKHYYCADTRGQLLYSKSGAEYNVDIQGWVSPVQQPQPDNVDTAGSEATTADGQPAAANSENSESAAQSSSNKKTKSNK